MISSFAVQFAGFGKAERGIEIARDNQDPDEQMSALTQIAQILTIQNDDTLAASTLELIPEEAKRVFALIPVGRPKQKKGNKEAAITHPRTPAAPTHTTPPPFLRGDRASELPTALKRPTGDQRPGREKLP